MIHLVDAKTGSESWIPLFDDSGAPIYPELMDELDAIKRDRIGGLMLCRDWGNRGPWPTWPKPHMPDFTHMSRKVKQVVVAAGLRDELSMTSFRHGGLTESGDAELTDREILAQSRHTTVKVLPKLRQAHHEADHHRHQEAARGANEGWTIVRMSSNPPVRMKSWECRK
jgi:hypothetical protein